MRPSLKNNELNAINQVLKSKFLTEGKVTRKFEDAISQYTKSKFAIATTSATTALHSVFEAINIKGKKVFILELLFIKLGATSKKTPNR